MFLVRLHCGPVVTLHPFDFDRNLFIFLSLMVLYLYLVTISNGAVPLSVSPQPFWASLNIERSLRRRDMRRGQNPLGTNASRKA